MMKQKILLSLLSIFIVTNLILLLKIRQKNEDLANCDNLSSFYEKKVTSTDSYISSFIKASLLNENKPIKKLEITDIENGEVLKINDLKLCKPVLVFGYAESHCQQCVEDMMRLLKTSFKLDSVQLTDNVIFLGSYSVTRDMKLFLQSQMVNVKGFRILNGNPDCSISEEPNPVLFVLNPDNTIHNYFQCSEDNRLQIKEYLELVGKKLANYAQ